MTLLAANRTLPDACRISLASAHAVAVEDGVSPRAAGARCDAGGPRNAAAFATRGVEGLLRTTAAAALSLFAFGAISAWLQHPERFTLLLLVVTESINVVLVLASRRAQQRDWQPFSVALALVTTFYFLALTSAPGVELLSQPVSCAIQGIGVAWQIYAKCSLGRSFGLLPADRGLVTTGAYRWVRHPIYLGYLICHAGFLLANFSAQNATVFAVLYLLQGLRMLREERLLAHSPEYRSYCGTVRFRLVPFLF